MEELRQLVRYYDSYYEMADDSPTYRRGAEVDRRIRALAAELRAQGHGPEIDSLAAEYPCLIPAPGGPHALACV
jgi:hypothetical protein